SQQLDAVPQVTQVDADHRLVRVHELDGVEPGDGGQLRDGPEVIRPRAGGTGGEAEADETSQGRQAAVALAEGAGGVEHDVDAAAAGDALYLRLEVAPPLAARVRHAGLAQHRVLARRRGADDLRPRDAAELDRRHAHPAGGGVHQHAISLADVAEVPQHEDGGEVVH